LLIFFIIWITIFIPVLFLWSCYCEWKHAFQAAEKSMIQFIFHL
jgi:NADH:ubiquinone oxidoreductase subunit 4 (subunit M)